MEFIKGITFAPFAAQGSFANEKAKQSLKSLQERTGANFIILVPNGLQDTAQSEVIDFKSKANVSDEELREMIRFAKSLGLKVALNLQPIVKMVLGEHTLISLIKMCIVNLNGIIGLSLIQIFRYIMHVLLKKKAVR